VPDLRALSWNLFHGRDHPRDPALFTLRSRLLGVTEHNATHAQVNRVLLDEFAQLIAQESWSVCLLQEAPPWWSEPLARRCDAEAQRVLTSRNQLAPLRRALARWNPDLLGSAEGGSNLTLVRPPWRITERRSLLLNPLPRRGLRERRRMAFLTATTGSADVCVGNLHATADDRLQAEQDVRRAADAAVRWSRGRPLLLGGDFNLRPASSSVFEELERRYGLAGPSGGPRSHAIDHLLVRGMEAVEHPAPWPEGRRELQEAVNGALRRLRLSDHAPLEACYRLCAPGVR
jgi:endonuclease/exonuclease/phosphatase family metal-dependent hydrolase